MVEVLNPTSGDRILDIGAGYGAATRELIKGSNGHMVHYTLLEKSPVQVDRAREMLQALTSNTFVEERVSFANMPVLNNNLNPGQFNKAIAKSVIHEFPREERLATMQSVYHNLEKGGMLVVWQYDLNDDCKLFNQIIRKKDQLAGYDSMVHDRNFVTEPELIALIQEAGFTEVKKHHQMNYHLNTSYRLEGEFKGDEKTLETWNSYIEDLLAEYDDAFKQRIQYKREGNNISICFKQSLYSALKA